MSLRDLARAYLDGERRRVAGQACPVSGRLSVSGPDKTTQPPIVLRGEPIRPPLATRTEIARPGALSGPDKPDASDKSDTSDVRANVERLLAEMAREKERRSDWWRRPPKGWTEGKLSLRNFLTGESEIFDFRKRRFELVTVTIAQLRAGRAALDWTTQRLASASRVHRETIGRIESGRVFSPQNATLARLVAALEQGGVVFAENGMDILKFSAANPRGNRA